jgi:hypothetical protein
MTRSSRPGRARPAGATAGGPPHAGSRQGTRALTLMALAGLLAACGTSSADKPVLGSPARPLVGTAAPGGEPSSRASKAPGYDSLVANQLREPATRFTPCNLVTRSEAQAIVGAPLLVPFEGPQGPTCIYRGKAGDTFMTIAVEHLIFESIRPSIRERRRLKIAGRTAYCGTFGREALFVVLSRGRVLSIFAPCDTARRLALKALPRLVS